MRPNDPGSATRPTGRNDCNRDAPVVPVRKHFAAAHGSASSFEFIDHHPGEELHAVLSSVVEKLLNLRKGKGQTRGAVP